MATTPDTRSSLIARIGDFSDADAWREFTQIYEPFLYRQARRRGLQHADARELVQDVLIAVSRSIRNFKIDRSQGRFRTWLYAVGRNIALQHLARLRKEPCSGAKPVDALQEQALPSTSSDVDPALKTELRRHTFQWAADQVRQDFTPRSWQAFWKTAVENQSVQQTATQLKMSVGAVYIARSRVMACLRRIVQEITLDDIPEAYEPLHASCLPTESVDPTADAPPHSSPSPETTS